MSLRLSDILIIKFFYKEFFKKKKKKKSEKETKRAEGKERFLHENEHLEAILFSYQDFRKQ